MYIMNMNKKAVQPSTTTTKTKSYKIALYVNILKKVNHHLGFQQSFILE